MGNCLDLQKPTTTWVEDGEDGYWEWDSMESSESQQLQQQKKSSPMAGATEIKIKIKISKKQLEEMLRQVDSERVPFRRALLDLASGCTELSSKDQQHEQLFLHHRGHEMGHWKPELQSIPEVPE